MNFLFGTVNSRLRQMELQTRWNLKKQGKSSESPQELSLRRQAEDSRNQVRINSILGKLRTGKNLSTQEMDYLRRNSPELYRKAAQIKQERDGFRKQLEKCATKEQAEKVYEQKMNQFINEASAIKKSGMSAANKESAMESLQMRMAAVEDEYRNFCKGMPLPEEKKQRVESEKEDQLVRKAASDTETKDAEPSEAAQSNLQAVLSHSTQAVCCQRPVQSYFPLDLIGQETAGLSPGNQSAGGNGHIISQPNSVVQTKQRKNL